MSRTAIAIIASVLAAASAQSGGGNWTIIATNLGVFSTGVTFNADGKTGYLVTDANGVGANIEQSLDGGITWNPTTDPFELMPLDVTSYGSNVADMGALVIGEYSNNAGSSFNDSTIVAPKGTFGGAGQCIRNLGSQDAPIGFAMVGTFGLFTELNGVAISTDAGATYTAFNITTAITDTRYGSFIDANTWYVSAGEWPGEGSDSSSGSGSGSGSSSSSSPTTAAASGVSHVVRRLTQRASIVQGADGVHRLELVEPASRRVSGRNLQAAGGYVSQILKTTNGGASFSSVYTSTAGYLNGIDCLDTSRCCVAQENDDADGFAAILCTLDGGATWTQNYVTNITGASLLDIRTVGTDGYWAVGGVESSLGSVAGFIYSGDGGATWTVTSEISGPFASSVDCARGTEECWATLLDVDTQSASLAYTGSTSSPAKKHVLLSRSA